MSNKTELYFKKCEILSLQVQGVQMRKALPQGVILESKRRVKIETYVKLEKPFKQPIC